MIIAIPTHLTNLKIISQMQKMLSEYFTNKSTPITNSTDDYLDDKAFDYVRELVSVIFEGNDEATNNYLANIFYECKGTTKIFNLMEKYLDIEYLTPPVYDIDRLIINFKVVRGADLSRFKPAMTNLLNTLLYFDQIKISIEVFKLYITSDIFNRSANNCVYYKESHFEFK